MNKRNEMKEVAKDKVMLGMIDMRIAKAI